MNYLKVLIILLLFVLTIGFVIQNTETLSQTVQLRLGYDELLWTSPLIPNWVLFVAGLVLGGLISMLYLLASNIRMASQLRDCRMRMGRLEQEVSTLRSRPVESYTTPLATPPSEPVEAPCQEQGADETKP